ncbi:MAG TPA: hypothetical protein VJT71_12560 [Pyrinomonadaceae bacterium]|nr:hypothetical protein [Pyrinomonadaceae bacterium]
MQIFLTVGHGDWLPIPFFRPNDGESHPYVDLRENPAKIAEIPEATTFPELQQFFRDINGPNSFFRTLACITIAHEIAEPELPYEMRSYIDVTFIPWDWGTSAVNSFVVFYEFTKFIHEPEAQEIVETLTNVSVILNLKPAQQTDLNVPFWSMEWWIISGGKTSDLAREGWANSLDLLRRLLLKVSPLTKQQCDLAKVGPEKTEVLNYSSPSKHV